jgi:hypothetical protein
MCDFLGAVSFAKRPLRPSAKKQRRPAKRRRRIEVSQSHNTALAAKSGLRRLHITSGRIRTANAHPLANQNCTDNHKDHDPSDAVDSTRNQPE